MHDSCRHRECRNTCRADHRIDFVFREQVHYLGAHNAAYGVEYEREQTERHNRKRFDLQEFFRLHLERYRNTEQQGYKIAQRMGNFDAYGPILLGLNAPINDLSRGCNASEVYSMAIITAALA